MPRQAVPTADPFKPVDQAQQALEVSGPEVEVGVASQPTGVAAESQPAELDTANPTEVDTSLLLTSLPSGGGTQAPPGESTGGASVPGAATTGGLDPLAALTAPPPSVEEGVPVVEGDLPQDEAGPEESRRTASGAPVIEEPPPTSSLAVVSLSCGMLGLFLVFFWGLLALPAVVCGHLALKRIKSEPSGQVQGRGMAIGGLVMGYLGLACQLGMIVILVVALGAAKT